MTIKEKIKNSIRAYILGDALGVPFEFKDEGTFKCTQLSEGGFHGQIKGTWSDDTSILLCLLDAFTRGYYSSFENYIQNLKKWVKGKGFNAGDSLFDIGCQTSEAINRGGCEKTDRMGNGALFYCLPIAYITLDKDDCITKSFFEDYCSYTHNNDNCFEYGTRLCCIIKQLLRTLPSEKYEVSDYSNKGDVINTYNLVVDNFNVLCNKSTSLFEDLCTVVNCGCDTDTNAAIFGSLIGCIKPIEQKHWKKIRKYEYIDKLIDNFVDIYEKDCYV